MAPPELSAAPGVVESTRGTRGERNTPNSSIVPGAVKCLLWRDSNERLRTEDSDLMVLVRRRVRAADREWGRPLDYPDPVGERATWNVILADLAKEVRHAA